jgi:plastocyanin
VTSVIPWKHPHIRKLVCANVATASLSPLVERGTEVATTSLILRVGLAGLLGVGVSLGGESARATAPTVGNIVTYPGAWVPGVVSGVGSGLNYAPPVVIVPKGTAVTYTNLDYDPHNVTSVKTVQVRVGKKWVTKRLFSAATILASQIGSSVPVVGAEKLPAGTYNFFCSVHPWMQGQLIIQ